MSRAANSEITVSFPSGTGFTGYTGGAVVDTTSSPTTTIGSCGSPSGTVIKCGLFGGEAIPASHNVSITFSGITNPAAGTPTLSVSTTSDPAAVTSPAFSVVAANQVSALSVALSNPSAAAGARTQYVVGFHVSSTGGMSRAANSEITVSFPSGTGFTGYTGGAVVDTTSSPTTTIGSCGSPSGTVIKCGLFGGEAIPASHNVSITFSGITNPAAGTPTLSVSTTSDPAAVTSASLHGRGGQSAERRDAGPRLVDSERDHTLGHELPAVGHRRHLARRQQRDPGQLPKRHNLHELHRRRRR